MKWPWANLWTSVMPARDKPLPPEHPPRRWHIRWGSRRWLIELGIAAFFLGLAVWLIVVIVRFFLGVEATVDKLGP
jgi:hypothetical protein